MVTAGAREGRMRWVNGLFRLCLVELGQCISNMQWSAHERRPSSEEKSLYVLCPPIPTPHLPFWLLEKIDLLLLIIFSPLQSFAYTD